MNLEKRYAKKLEIYQLKLQNVNSILLYILLLKQTKSLIKIINRNLRINKKRVQNINYAITPPYENGLTNNQAEYCIIRETGAIINYWWDVLDKNSYCSFIQDYYEEKTNSIEAFLIILAKLKKYFIFSKSHYDLINYYVLVDLLKEVFDQTLDLYSKKLSKLQKAFQKGKSLKNIQAKKINIVEEIKDFIFENFDIIDYDRKEKK